MNNIKFRKKHILLVSIISLIIIFFSTLCYLLFYNSSYNVPKVKVASTLVDKIRQSQKEGTVLELNEEELNQIISMYFKDEKSYKNIRIKGVYGDIDSNKLRLYIPTSYKGFNFLMSSEGQLLYENNKIGYKPSYFKLGKISLPTNLVLEKMGSYLKDNIAIDNGAIVMNKKAIPLQIKSLEINKDKVLVGIEKSNSTLEEKIKSLQDNTALKNAVNSEANESTNNNSANTNSTTNSSETETNKSNTSKTSSNTSEMDAALDRISGSLNGAMGSVSTGGQRAVISAMISTTNSMKGNPNANPYAAANSVRAVYNNLSPQEKAELKSAVFSSVDGGDVNIVASMIGK